MEQKIFRVLFGAALVAAFGIPFFIFTPTASAAARDGDLEVSGWIPYWASKDGTRDTREHIEIFDEINPFGFSVRTDGSLHDLMGIKKSNWKRLIKEATKEDVLVIPTVMWSNGSQIHQILSDKDTRTKHIKAIVTMVNRGKYDGVDIDYEGKLSQTNVFFSLFLLELKQALGNKTLSCTIEARTPPESLYVTLPKVLSYANDYKSINLACDQVKIMTYDQQRADLDLNGANVGQPYIPVSDIAWVRKVLNLTLQTIPKEKIMLGIPTYGREWVVTVAPNWFKSYQNLQALNRDKALDAADDYRVTPARNQAGEISFTFIPENSPYEFLLQNNSNTNNANSESNKRKSRHQAPIYVGNDIAMKALSYANLTGQTLKFNIIWWSDAEAIRQKVDLAQELGLRGVSIFKIDGETDPDLWDVLKD
jgi:spore germination protein YaaH